MTRQPDPIAPKRSGAFFKGLLFIVLYAGFGMIALPMFGVVPRTPTGWLLAVAFGAIVLVGVQTAAEGVFSALTDRSMPGRMRIEIGVACLVFLILIAVSVQYGPVRDFLALHFRL